MFSVELVRRGAHHRLRRQLAVASVLVMLLAVAAAAPASAGKPTGKPLGSFQHLVVIYEENHSFDNLYGLWGTVGTDAVQGLASLPAGRTVQVDQSGNPYQCLLQTDINLRTSVQGPATGTTTLPNNATGPLTESCTQDVLLGDGATSVHISSAFGNAPFPIDPYIGASYTTCPDGDHLFSYPNGILNGNGLIGGCTRDLVHRFYQEQYQLNGGSQNRYVTGSDSAAMSMGYYDTTQLPIYEYLHGPDAPNYVIADRFFQAAFGGSFLNHQFLVAAEPPAFAGGSHSVLDASGMPRGKNNAYPLYKTNNTSVVDGNSTQACGLSTTVAGLACGDYAVNTMNPWYQPTGLFGQKLPPINDTNPAGPGYTQNIGDLLSAANVSWAYYGGGWDNASGNTAGLGYTNGPGPTCGDPNSVPATADGDNLNAGYPYCPDKSFQVHHYPLNYFAAYAPGQPGRAHLQDEAYFFQAAAAGTLPSVSFVKPVGAENEHPGYTSEPNGSDHLVDLIQAVLSGPDADSTLVLVTYDEFGGEWDHVAPPGQHNNAAPHDVWGPGTRIPALLVGAGLTSSGVDHTSYDTTSILRTIEAQWGLGNLGHRDATVNSLANMVKTGTR
jgi:acid phosphatase